jgi:hypothetical protein
MANGSESLAAGVFGRHGMTTTLVTVHLPAQFSLEGEAAALRPTSIARLEMARADWVARSINDFVPKMDRGANRDHQKLVTMLIAHEMHLRSALTSEEGGHATVKVDALRAAHGPEWIEAARAARVEAVRRAGLEQDLFAANRYTGIVSSQPSGPLLGVPEPIGPDRIRTFGRPVALLGLLPGMDDPHPNASLLIGGRPWEESVKSPTVEMIGALLVLLLIGLLGATFWRGVLAQRAALVMTLGLAGFMGGPLSLAAAIGVATVTFVKGRRERFT